MSSFSSSPLFMSDPAFSSNIAHNPMQWPPAQANLTHHPSNSSSSGHSSASSSSHSSSSFSSSDMPSQSALPDVTMRRKKKSTPSAPPQAPKSTNPILSHPPLSRSRSSLFAPKGHQLDRIDELDESSPLGPLHHGGPYEIAARKASAPLPQPAVTIPDNDIDEHNSRYLSSELDDDDPEECRASKKHAFKPKKSSRPRTSKQLQFAPGSLIGKPLNLVPGQIVPRGVLESFQFDPSQSTTNMASVANWESQSRPRFTSVGVVPPFPSPMDHWSSSQSTSSSSSGSFSSGQIRAAHPSISRLRRHGSSESFTSEPSSPTSSNYSHSSKESHKSSVPPRHRGRHAHGAPTRNLAPRHVAENMRQQQFALQVSMLNNPPTGLLPEDVLIPTSSRIARQQSSVNPRLPASPPPNHAYAVPRGMSQDAINAMQHSHSDVPLALTDTMRDMSLSSSSNRNPDSPSFDCGQPHLQSSQWSGVDKPPKRLDARGTPDPQLVRFEVPNSSSQESNLLQGQDRRRSLPVQRSLVTSQESDVLHDERHTPSPAGFSAVFGAEKTVPPATVDAIRVNSEYDMGIQDHFRSDEYSIRLNPEPLHNHVRQGSNASWTSAPLSINLSAPSSITSFASDGPRPHYLPKKLVMPTPLQKTQPAVSTHPAAIPYSASRTQPMMGGLSPVDSYDPYAEAQNYNPVIPDLHGRRVLKKRTSVAATPVPVPMWQNQPNATSVFPPQASQSSFSYSANVEKEAQKTRKLNKRRSDF